MNRFPPDSRFRRRAGATLLACGLSLAAPAWADEYAEVQKLQREGQTTQALDRADKYIAANPRDPQMRFIKANILSANQRVDEAEQMLMQLTRQDPELPDSWNNLAVLLAAKGQLGMALDELQTALRLNPNYATALENLGDLQARLALQSYQRAQKLEAGNRGLPAKIDALRTVTDTLTKPGS